MNRGLTTLLPEHLEREFEQRVAAPVPSGRKSKDLKTQMKLFALKFVPEPDARMRENSPNISRLSGIRPCVIIPPPPNVRLATLGRTVVVGALVVVVVVGISVLNSSPLYVAQQ